MLLPIPTRYAVGPAALYIVSRIAYSVLVTFNILTNPYLKDSIPHKFTALLPDATGKFAPDNKPPTNENVAVLILSAKVNHPSGWLGAPHVQAFGDLFTKMKNEFETWPQSETGFLGQSQAHLPAANGCTEILSISYWRSAAHIMKYADSPSHREAVTWWYQKMKEGTIPHLGIMHEIYQSPPGMWENVYMGFQPTLLGATTYLKEGDKTVAGTVEDKWISPILDARKGKLASSRGRMGWDVRVNEKPEF